MSWFKLDDQFPHHPKVMRAGPDAAWLFVAGGCYCASHLTDGLIPKCALPTLSTLRNPEKLAARLVEVGLWVELDDDYEVNDYLEYNPSREDVEETRRAARERRAKGGKRSADVRANVSNPDPTRPDVLTEHENSSSTKGLTEAYEECFTQWWEDYPRKVNRKAAMTAYKARRREGVSHDRLVTARDHYALSRIGEPDQFTLHGSTFLAKDGPWSEWESETIPVKEPVYPWEEEPKLVLPPARVDVCPVCESSMLACVCRRSHV